MTGRLHSDNGIMTVLPLSSERLVSRHDQGNFAELVFALQNLRQREALARPNQDPIRNRERQLGHLSRCLAGVLLQSVSNVSSTSKRQYPYGQANDILECLALVMGLMRPS